VHESVDKSLGAPVVSPDDVLTAVEVAAVLRMTPAWVYSETRQGRIPHMRFGRRFRYRRSTIESWMRTLEWGRLGPPRVEHPTVPPLDGDAGTVRRPRPERRKPQQQARLF